MLVRERCIASPLYLATEILSCVWQANLFVTPSPAHLAVEQAIIGQRDLIFVGARGIAKTTLNIETGAVWQLLKFPNDSIALFQATEPVAKQRSEQVRAHFIRNPKLRAYFPEYAMSTVEQQGDVRSWSVPCRTVVTTEGSFDICTPGAARTGNHYDLILCTDLMNPETTPPPCGRASLEMMNGLVAWTSQFSGLQKHKSINPRAHKRFDSNRWHDGDLVGEMKRRNEAGRYALIEAGVSGENGAYVSPWPEVLSSAEIQAIHDDPQMNEATFAANFKSDPLPDGGTAFKDEWLHTYPSVCKAKNCGQFHKHPKLPRGVAICVDPSFGDAKAENKKSDRSGMLVWGTGTDGNFYAVAAKAGRWTADDFVEHLWALAVVHKPTWVGIEDTGGARGLKAIFRSRQVREGKFFRYRDLKTLTKSKDSRASALHSHAQHFGLYIHDDAIDLRDELLRYGVARFDDLADCAFYAGMELYSVPREKQETKPEPMYEAPVRKIETAREILERRIRRNKAAKMAPWMRVTSRRFA